MSSSSTSREAVGQRLRWAREQAGLSQGQVARTLDYHRPTISQIEAGQRSVRPDELARFAELYVVNEAWIIKGNDALDFENASRVEIAARELRKLKSEDLETIMQLINVMRSKQEQDIE